MLKFSRISLEPIYRKQKGLDTFRVTDPVNVYFNGVLFLTIPGGFESDGASHPKALRNKWKSWGKYSAAALLHDYLLKHSDQPKWEIDTLFYIALRSCEVSALEAALFWVAVRLKRTKD